MMSSSTTVTVDDATIEVNNNGLFRGYTAA